MVSFNPNGPWYAMFPPQTVDRTQFPNNQHLNPRSTADRVVTITPYGWDSFHYGVNVTDTELIKVPTTSTRCLSVGCGIPEDQENQEPIPNGGQGCTTGIVVTNTLPVRTVTIASVAPFPDVTVVYKSGINAMFHRVDGRKDVEIRTEEKMIFQNDEMAQVWIQGGDNNSVVVAYHNPAS